MKSVLHSSPDAWVVEKVDLVNQLAELKLCSAELEEGVKQETLKHQACLIRIEELEIELDRLEREILSLKSAPAPRKHVSWGSSHIMDTSESLMPVPPSLSINIGKSHSRFDGSLATDAAASQLCCHLSVRVPHLRSKSIPPSVQF